ncbi:phospholipase A and acyltransferase 1-like [Pyrgilauda ruficollis]|uniref:phospholipase A and acyltransferase 1-like n=1 Tax=Pyrgilauda ruficollis TaxID=221976 RepID=UPI001B8727E1|nr:phospholipase A and acyltransferase 1-like [Pyrgilauda ruficollis]
MVTSRAGSPQGRRDPQPGDLIEIKRSRFYQHWALYVGDEYVIHVTDEGATSITLSSSSIRSTRAKVKKEPLQNVVENDEWRVNNKYDRSRTPRPVEEIIQRAEEWVGKEVPYNVLTRNCEHFVTELRYGEGVSEQAKAALQNINSVSSVVMAGIGTASFIVASIPFMASAPFVAAGSGGLLASIGFSSSNIVHSITFGKFKKAGRNILEQSCC